MIPILNSSTTLTGKGIGHLTDALSCVITHEINGEYELRMRYPVTGIHYGDLAENLIIWAEPDNMTQTQAFRIYRITRPLNNIVTVYARHIAYDMSGIIVKPFSAFSLSTALAAIPSNCSPSCPFSFSTTRSTTVAFEIKEPTVLWAMMGGTEGSLLDVYGGEWDFDNLTAKSMSRLGSDRGVAIRYGKNMTELEQDITIESTYAGVFPYWYDGETDTLVKLASDYIPVSGALGTRLLLLDLSDEFDTQPTEAQLTTRAEAYIDSHDLGEPKISWKVNMAMLAQSEEFSAVLEQVMLGDTIHIFYEPMNLTATARAVKLEYDVLQERYNSITLGRVKQNLAKIVADTQTATANVVKGVKSTIEDAVAHATDFIRNGSGYMRFIYDGDQLTEIVSMDDPDIEQAQKVWRWNNGGFGFSSTGYNGPYTLAITQDGSIVADFIKSGTLDASQVTVENLDASKITTGQMSASRVNLTDYSTTSQMNAAITASETGILTTVSNTYQTQANAAVVNLLPSVYYRENQSGNTFVYNDVTWTLNADGSVTATGTATGTSWYVLTTSDTAVPDTPVDPQSKYTVSGAPNVEGCSITFIRYDASGAWLAQSTVTSTPVTSDPGAYTVRLELRVAGGTVLPNGGATWYPMLEKGDTAHAYVSTHGGSYAMESAIRQNANNIELKVSETDFTGNNIIGKINLTSTTATIAASHINLQGAVSITSLDSSLQSSVNGIPIVNLLPTVYRNEALYGTSHVSNGITWTVNADGSVTAAGTASAQSVFYISGNTKTTSFVPWINIDPTKKYTLSGGPNVTNCNITCQRFDSSGSSLGYQATETSRVMPEGASYAFVYLEIANGTAIPNGVTFFPMLEVGEIAHAYSSTHDGTGAAMTKITTNEQAISLEAQTRAADVGNVQSNLEAEIEIRSNQIQSLVENVETLDGSITQKVATAVTQSTSGLDARITSVKQTADDTAEVIDTHFEFSTAGMKIKGTEGSSDTSFLQLAADRVSLYENDTERLWLDEDGANAQAFNATQAVRVGSFIWEEYPGGFRLVKN